MRKILLVGELGTALMSMADMLSDEFWMQLAPEDAAMANRLRRIFNPDLVIWSGCLGTAKSDIENMIRDTLKMNRPPVLGMSTPDTVESMKLLAADFPGFEYVPRPTTKSSLIDACKIKLGMMKDDRPLPKSERKSVLVVDDNALETRRITRILTDKYNLITASSGNEAIEKATDNMPDVILLDYEMPGMNGRDTFMMMKQLESLEKIPVIFLTGVNDRSQIVKVLDLNPYSYILKPPIPDQLLQLLEKALGGDK